MKSLENGNLEAELKEAQELTQAKDADLQRIYKLMAEKQQKGAGASADA